MSSHEGLVANGYVWTGYGTCRDCGKRVLWYRTTGTDTHVPMDPITYAVHFATCGRASDNLSLTDQDERGTVRDKIVVSQSGGKTAECLRCGAKVSVSLPTPVPVWCAVMKAFVKIHRRCKEIKIG